MEYHENGPLKGKTTVDNGTSLNQSVQTALTQQLDFIKRMDEPAFRDAVRLASRADDQHPDGLNGAETALEQLHRHQCGGDLTSNGVIESHNAASRVTGYKPSIIRV